MWLGLVDIWTKRAADMLVGRLRRKIEPDAKPPRLIVTVPGEGYKFAVPIRTEALKLSPENATLKPTASRATARSSCAYSPPRE
jgi:DNA-binding winged helix-turn-helix (wHTH) protein